MADEEDRDSRCPLLVSSKVACFDISLLLSTYLHRIWRLRDFGGGLRLIDVRQQTLILLSVDGDPQQQVLVFWTGIWFKSDVFFYCVPKGAPSIAVIPCWLC